MRNVREADVLPKITQMCVGEAGLEFIQPNSLISTLSGITIMCLPRIACI